MAFFEKKIQNKKVGLALGGGAALGLAHIGVLKYLEEIDVKPTVISGTSIGSVIGGMYAAGLKVKKIEEIASQFDNKTQMLKLLSFAFQKSGIISHANIEKFFRQYLGDKKIEECDIDFVAVTVDLIKGTLLFINKGDLVDAIQASISIPGIFNTFEANGTLMVDGGVRENLPLKPLQAYKTDYIISVNLLKTEINDDNDSFCEIDKTKKYDNKANLNLFERISDAFKQKTLPKLGNDLPDMTTTSLQSLKYLLDEDSRSKKKLYHPDMAIDLNLKNFKLWEFWRSEELIKVGYETAKKQLG